MARQIVTVGRGSGMTFDEIARAMGSNKEAIVATYARAMKKLKARPRALQVLQGLASEVEQQRSKRQPIDVVR